jgi:DNA-binding winged helix-turn-helix (wHTH) protein
MPNPSPDPSVVRFGEYEFDLRSGELASGERKILLADQPFRLLVLLVRARGQLVSREELRRELWSDDTFVDFELSLNAAVRRLRETLGDSASSPRFIQTLPRRGYRFIAEVNGTGASAASPTGAARASDAMQSAPEHAAAKGVAAGTRVRALATGGLVLAMLGFLAMRVWPLRTESAPTHPAARVKPLTQDGSVRLAALSPDGGAVAYVRASGTRESLWLGPISALPGSQIVGPAEGTFRSLSFGPDGFIYYTFFQPDRTVVALYRVYARGGEP